MSAFAVCTWMWLKNGGRQDDAALARTYAPPAALFFVLGLVIGVFCLFQVACLCLGVRSKSPGLLWAIARALIGRAAPAAAPKEEEDNDPLEEPGCCACIQAQHRWGLGGVVCLAPHWSLLISVKSRPRGLGKCAPLQVSLRSLSGRQPLTCCTRTVVGANWRD